MDLGLQAEVEKVTDIDEIIEMGVMMTPLSRSMGR